MSPEAESFLHAEIHYADVGAAEIAYRKLGDGKPLLLVHGWPLWGFTFRKLLPRLAAEYTCYVVDLPGAGFTRYQEGNDFRFAGQAANLARFLERLSIGACHVLAHDTGATIARQLALITGETIQKMALINTEIPGHRPPWIQLFQQLTALPGNSAGFRLLLRSKAFLRSSMAFGNCFADKRLIAGEFEEHFVRPLIERRERMEGQIRYLRGIDWTLVDSLAVGHGRIRGPVLLVWGAEDPTFPLSRAKEMIPQFAHCAGLRPIDGAKLLVHEEKPQEVANHVLEFLRAGPP